MCRQTLSMVNLPMNAGSSSVEIHLYPASVKYVLAGRDVGRGTHKFFNQLLPRP